MARRSFTQEQKLRAKQLYVDESKAIRAVQEFLECSQPTATKVLREEGVTIRKKGRISKPIIGPSVVTTHWTQVVKEEGDGGGVEPIEEVETSTGLSTAVEEARQKILKTYADRAGVVSNR